MPRFLTNPLLACLTLAITLNLATGPAFAVTLHPGAPVSASELQQDMERLSVLGSVLYVAAHPDDENTAVLAYLARGRNLRTAYLSLTRGAGGQNLIGTEKGAPLGVVRTQELLAARRVDGAEQFFTRAIDFGYTKSADEALAMWQHEEVLRDVVWVVRKFRPDVMLTRFRGDGSGGHGQHVASALLAREAFEAAADPDRFPDQLEFVDPWQARRLLWDVWRGANVGDVESGVSVDVGAYNPLLGVSYREIAAASRSMHKSQGFGASAGRGSLPVTFEHTVGQEAEEDLLAGLDLTWNRVAGGRLVGRILKAAADRFDPRNPAAVVPQLIEALEVMEQLEPDPWIEVKRREIQEVIRAATGLWLAVLAERPTVAIGTSVPVTVDLINRSDVAIDLVELHLPFAAGATGIEGRLGRGKPLGGSGEIVVPSNATPGQPYWLAPGSSTGRYQVSDSSLTGQAEGEPPMATVLLEIEGRSVEYRVPVLYQWTDPVEGERFRPLAVVPVASLVLQESVLVVPQETTKSLHLTVESGVDGLSGQLEFDAPTGWRIHPESAELTSLDGGELRSFEIEVAPAQDAERGSFSVRLDSSAGTVATSTQVIDHRHIPVQVLFPRAAVRLVPLEVATRGSEIGYVMGAGDEIPAALEQLGYRVQQLSDTELGTVDLSSFDAIVLGIRAYNTRAGLSKYQQRLLEYVNAGGTLVAQYNTLGQTFVSDLGPYPMEISRGRVTMEEAAVEILEPEHALLREPNTITEADFQDWVQERGLYFPGSWDDRYTPILSSRDGGEDPLHGGLLYTRYGEGVFIYAAYSFFRQLPAGVPGAFRLFVNLISAR